MTFTSDSKKSGMSEEERQLTTKKARITAKDLTSHVQVVNWNAHIWPPGWVLSF